MMHVPILKCVSCIFLYKLIHVYLFNIFMLLSSGEQITPQAALRY